MAIFILSFFVITITMLTMAISVWCGKSPIEGSCSGAILEDKNTDSCRSCHCGQTNVNKVDNECEQS